MTTKSGDEKRKYSRRFAGYTAMLATVLILGVFITFYLLFYVSGNESKINERQFRILERIAFNINHRIPDFSRLANVKLDESVDRLSRFWKNTKISPGIAQKNAYKINLVTTFDSLNSGMFEFVKCCLKDSAVIVKDSSFSESRVDSTWIIEENNEMFVVFKKHYNWPYATKGIGQNDSLYIGFRIGKYLPMLLKRDFFSNYIFIKNKRIIYSDLNVRIDSGHVSDLLDSSSAFLHKTIRKINITGKSYFLYSIPFSISGNDVYLMVGVVPMSKINNEKYFVSDTFIFLLLFLIFGVAIAFPFLKVLMVGPREKLNTRDIMGIMLSLTIGASLLFYGLFNLYQDFVVDSFNYRQQQRSFSEQLTGSFIADINLAYDQLNAADDVVSTINSNLVNISTPEICSSPDGIKPDSAQAVKIKPQYPHFKLISWLDTTGNDLFKWMNDDKLPADANYSDRQYFTDIKNNATLQVPGRPGKNFTIQPIRSWTDGEFRAVIAKPSVNKTLLKDGKNINVMLAAISCRLPSVISPVIPAGYQFAIINESGEVLFHSDRNRCLNENMIDECNHNQRLLSGIYTRTAVFFNENYSGNSSRIYLEPVKGLPFYILTFYNIELIAIKNIKIFLITVFFILMLIFFTGLQMGLLMLFNVRSTRLKSNKLRLEWLWPDYRKFENYKKYLFLNAVMFVLSLLITGNYCIWDTPGLSFFIFSFNSLITLSLYFFISHYTFYTRELSPLNYSGFIFFILISLLMMNTVAYFKLDDLYKNAFFYQLIVFGFIVLIFHRQLRSGKQVVNVKFEKMAATHKEQVNMFSVMLLSWVLLIAVLPVLRFYELAYNNESEIITRLEQLSLVKQINRQTNVGGESFNKYFKIINGKNQKFRNIYIDFENFGTTIDTVVTNPGSSNNSEAANRNFICWLNRKVKVIFNELSSHEYLMGNFDRQDSSTFQWKPNQKGELVLTAIENIKSIHRIGDSLTITSQFPRYSLPQFNTRENLSVISFWISILVLVFVFYIVIRHFIRLLFLPGYFQNSYKEQMAYIKYLASHKTRNKFYGTIMVSQNYRIHNEMKLVIVSLPNSGKREFLNNNDNFKLYNKVYIDFAFINSSDEWAGETKKLENAKADDLLVLLHFEYYISDDFVNKTKLKVLEELFRKKYRNIIIVSAIHPSAFINNLNDEELSINVSGLFKDNNYYIWTSLLSSFEVVYYPLLIPDGPIYHENTSAAWVIYNECCHGLFLKSLMKKLIMFTGKKQKDLVYSNIEEIILNIQSSAYNYYLSIWNLLSLDEQYVLHDLAEDSLVNYKNFEPLSQLNQKGLILNNGRIDIMNNSFRNFILTEVRTGSLILNEVERTRDSSWSKFKGPFYIVLVTVLFFIFYTQQETYNTITTIIGSFTASLPLLIKIFAAFNTKGNNQT